MNEQRSSWEKPNETGVTLLMCVRVIKCVQPPFHTEVYLRRKRKEGQSVLQSPMGVLSSLVAVCSQVQFTMVFA